MTGTLGGSVVAGKRVLQFVAMIYIGRSNAGPLKQKKQTLPIPFQSIKICISMFRQRIP